MTKGLKFFAVDYNGKRVSKVYKILGGVKEKVLTCTRLLAQGSRNDIRKMLPLKNGNILVTAKRRTLIFNPEGEVVNTFTDFQGKKPLYQGMCITLDGTIFFGEYVLNSNRDMKIRLFDR